MLSVVAACRVSVHQTGKKRVSRGLISALGGAAVQRLIAGSTSFKCRGMFQQNVRVRVLEYPKVKLKAFQGKRAGVPHGEDGRPDVKSGGFRA